MKNRQKSYLKFLTCKRFKLNDSPAQCAGLFVYLSAVFVVIILIIFVLIFISILIIFVIVLVVFIILCHKKHLHLFRYFKKIRTHIPCFEFLINSFYKKRKKYSKRKQIMTKELTYTKIYDIMCVE